MNKNTWYKTWWGILLAICIWPFFLTWYIWTKTKYTQKVKWVATGIIAVLFITFASAAGSDSTSLADKKTDNTPAVEIKRAISPTAKPTTPPATLKSELYSVVKVVDGDTLDVDIKGKTERLRLIGIDTPETVDPRKPVQCFGKEASNKAKELLTGKRVSLEADATQGERDKYDRLLRFVFLENGADFQKLMISEGYAHEYTYNLPYKYMDQYKQAEKTAREASKGLWATNTCNGDTVKAAVLSTPSTSTPPVASTPSSSSNSSNPSGVVKKSSTGICHAPGTTYYDRTTNYTPFNTVQACLDSGGRLPLR